MQRRVFSPRGREAGIGDKDRIQRNREKGKRAKERGERRARERGKNYLS